MKKWLTIGLVGAGLAATLTFVAASSAKRGEPVTEADALPPYEIVNTVRSMGLRPAGEPLRRGPYYVMPATDPRGTEVRVTADAQLGNILAVEPSRTASAAPNYQRGPRIIHVPQAGARANNRASVNSAHDDDAEEAAPPPRRRAAPPPPQQRPAVPRWQPRSETPPPPAPVQRRSDAPPPEPPGPRRAVLSAPPPAAENPTWIRPTPRFGAKPDKIESAEKFAEPRELSPSVPPPMRDVTPPPPRGYAPPRALPAAD